jgi:hypothetical protein
MQQQSNGRVCAAASVLLGIGLGAGLLAPGKLAAQPSDSVQAAQFQDSGLALQSLDTAQAAISPRPECRQQDIGDLFRKKDKPAPEPKSAMFLVLPNVSYNPVNGFLMGVAGSTGFFLGDAEDTRVSSIAFNAAYTTRKQLLFFAKSNIYTNRDRFFLQGDWRYLIYNAYTWGLGTNAPDSLPSDNNFIWQGAHLGDIANGFGMEYNYLKFHEVLNYSVAENHYVGLGYHLDRYSRIEDLALQLDETPFDITPHYAYSRLYGFDPGQYTLSGWSLNYVYDSRDNLINPYTGYFVNINYRYNPEFMGSSRESSSLWTEFRTYLPLSRQVERHVLGFWFFSQVQVSGRQPYLTLMALGDDQRGRSGRGYLTGRYRGEHMVYSEVEYRFPISPCSKILGGVVYLNAATLSNNTRSVALFDYVRPGAGFGLRLMVNETFRTNITLDFGWGYRSQGFYFSGAETF